MISFNEDIPVGKLWGILFQIWQNTGVNDVNDTLNIRYVRNKDIGTTVRDFP